MASLSFFSSFVLFLSFYPLPCLFHLFSVFFLVLLLLSLCFLVRDYPCILQGSRVVEIQEALEESQMALNTMNAMRHVTPFKDRVVNMLTTLSDVSGKQPGVCTPPLVSEGRNSTLWGGDEDLWQTARSRKDGRKGRSVTMSLPFSCQGSSQDLF